MKPTAWYDPTNGAVSTDKDSPLFTPLGQVWPLFLEEQQITADCPNCEYHKQRAQRWRDEAYKQAGHPLPEREQKPEACKECHLKDLVYDLLGELKVANLKLSVRAKRTWVGLTDDEIWEAYMESPLALDCSTDELYALSRTVEAKLKEKNT
jgi:hypothetical protein